MIRAELTTIVAITAALVGGTGFVIGAVMSWLSATRKSSIELKAPGGVRIVFNPADAKNLESAIAVLKANAAVEAAKAPDTKEDDIQPSNGSSKVGEP